MEQGRRHSLLWILILLAALFIGPAILLNQQLPTVQPGPDLRTAIEQEKLLDAPAPLPPDQLKP